MCVRGCFHNGQKKRDMLIIENRLSLNEEGILRKQEGMYVPHRKRGYLYWFKFLQEAERSDDFMVNWIKYRG